MSHVLKEAYHIDLPEECRLRYVKSDKERFRLHSHEYHEVFLMLGDITHTVNGTTSRLSAGTLMFIRDRDEHLYTVGEGEYVEFLNLAFSRSTFDLLTQYLGEGFPARSLLDSRDPIVVKLSSSDTDHLFRKFMNLNSIPANDRLMYKYEARKLIFSLFTKYLIPQEEESDPPMWLEDMRETIGRREVFTGPRIDITALSGKSREHTVREFKRYYGVTPTEYVNSLKLNYAVNLLSTSTLSVIEVSLEAGFSNLSWFNELFIRTYGTTPLRYRKMIQQKPR